MDVKPRQEGGCFTSLDVGHGHAQTFCPSSTAANGLNPQGTGAASVPEANPGAAVTSPTTSVESVVNTVSGTAANTASLTQSGTIATAQPVASTTQSPSVSSHGGNGGVSKGAAAGIAVGTAIVGAAIAFLVAFLLFRKRRKGPSPALKSYESTPEFAGLSKNGSSPYVQVSQVVPPPVAATATSHARSNSSNDLLANILPPPADDSSVRHKIGALFDDIRQHIDKYYRDVHATVTPSMEGDLAIFGLGNISMVELLQSSSQPTFALKHALTGYILNITSSDGEAEATLFPSEIVGVGKKEHAASSQDNLYAYNLYKRLAVHFHAPTSSTEQSRKSDMREAAEHFALTFFPWASPESDDQEKDGDLVHIISNALDLIIWLYGQPASYNFSWETPVRRATVLSPGLVKVADGQSYVLLEPVTIST